MWVYILLKIIINYRHDPATATSYAILKSVAPEESEITTAPILIEFVVASV